MTNAVAHAASSQTVSPAYALYAGTTEPTYRVELDTRLIAAVQSRAGARCHLSANLIHSYYLCADVYRSKLRQGNVDASKAARQRFQDSENRLREFLFAARSSACLPAASLAHACVA
jgi:hypothetical protein